MLRSDCLVGVSYNCDVLGAASELPLGNAGEPDWEERSAIPVKFMVLGKKSRVWILGGSVTM